MNWWWTVHERLFMWTFQELLMNCSWTIFFHNKFLNSSWTVMMNSSWTLVFASILWTFHELFMNVHECSWTVHKVMNYISPGRGWHKGTYLHIMGWSDILVYDLHILFWARRTNAVITLRWFIGDFTLTPPYLESGVSVNCHDGRFHRLPGGGGGGMGVQLWNCKWGVRNVMVWIFMGSNLSLRGVWGSSPKKN